MLAADGQLTQAIRSLQSSPLPIGSVSDTFCRQSSATHSVCVFESLSDDMDMDECAAQPWRERGNVLTTSLHCGRVCMDFIRGLELCL